MPGILCAPDRAEVVDVGVVDGVGGQFRGGVQGGVLGDRVAEEEPVVDGDPAVAAVQAVPDPADQ
ncbi:hypothetical protein [Kitasatospora griseola]